MRIIRLQAEGFKRLVAVDISPEGDLIEIRGNNGEGKSSVLDAIFAALGGKEAAPVKPVRTGEEYALIKLDLGELRVTRYFDEDGTTKLKVENAEGAVFTQGQTMLDALVGSIAFDPLEFARMDPKAQAAEIRRLVKLDVDLDELAAADRADYEARRDVNREAKALSPRIAALVVPTGLPDEAPDKDALVAELTTAADRNNAITVEERRREDERLSANGLGAEALNQRERAKRLRREAEEADALADEYEERAKAISDELAALPPIEPRVDTSAVAARIAEADKVIAAIAVRDQRKRLSDEFEALRKRSEELSNAMAARAELREKALASAVMPVAGLGFATIGDDLVVTFNGEPFEQSSGAEQLRVSTAIAMAANPKLRVLRVKEGSLLDKNSLAILASMAKDNDFQIWGEFVGDEGAGIIMEAGTVRGAPEPERAEPPKRRKKGEPDAATIAAVETEIEGGPLATDSAIEVQRDRLAAKPERKRPQALNELSTPKPGSLL